MQTGHEHMEAIFADHCRHLLNARKQSQTYSVLGNVALLERYVVKLIARHVVKKPLTSKRPSPANAICKDMNPKFKDEEMATKTQTKYFDGKQHRK